MPQYHYRPGYQGVHEPGPDRATRHLLAGVMTAIEWLTAISQRDPALLASTRPADFDLTELRRRMAAVLEDLS